MAMKLLRKRYKAKMYRPDWSMKLAFRLQMEQVVAAS